MFISLSPNEYQVVGSDRLLPAFTYTIASQHPAKQSNKPSPAPTKPQRTNHNHNIPCHKGGATVHTRSFAVITTAPALAIEEASTTPAAVPRGLATRVTVGVVGVAARVEVPPGVVGGAVAEGVYRHGEREEAPDEGGFHVCMYVGGVG